MQYTPEYIDTVTHYCQVCFSKKRYVLLGSHVWQKHRVTADEYREMLGLAKNVRLIDIDVQRIKREQVTPEQIERLIKSAGNKFKKGFGGRPSSMVSPMTKERLSIVHTKRNPQNDRNCLRCYISFKGFKWRNYCDACVKLNNDDRRKNAATAGYYSNYHKERSKDPEYVKARTQKHKEWVEKNREKLNAYIRKYNRTKNCTGCDVAITKKSKTNMCIHCFNKRKIA